MSGQSLEHDAAFPDHSSTHEKRLEMLVRLIIRDELQRLPADPNPGSGGTTDADPPASGLALTAKRSEDSNEDSSDAEVMCAEDVAAFLGVDRNTVYDYAGRGTIPCHRLGKRLLFHRPALVAWLDPSKAASTRKA
jgi:excisionase family DNA binding protein